MIICEKHSKMIEDVVDESKLTIQENFNSNTFLDNEFLFIDPASEIKLRIISIAMDAMLRHNFHISDNFCPLCTAPNDNEAKNACELIATSLKYEYEISKIISKINEI